MTPTWFENVEQAQVARKAKTKDAIANRMLVNGNSCFITLKDHKPNFLNNPKVRLLHPAKNKLGRISKSILDKLNTSLRHNQSKSMERH